MNALAVQAYLDGIEVAAQGWNLMVQFPPEHSAHWVGWQDFCFGIGLAANAVERTT